jgi:hypothetical protein
MKRNFATLLAAAALSSCATANPAAVSWSECAKAQGIAWLESGIPSSWPTVESLPEDVPIQIVSLGADPPDAIHDALYRTLHLVQSRNAIYVEQTGGIAGMRTVYGPVSLAGKCSAAPSRMP